MSTHQILGPRRPGRNKIIYAPEDLLRPPLITVVVGMQGIGKTRQTIKDIDTYVEDDPNNGRKAGKALILDFSMDELYQKYKPVLTQNIRQLTEPRCRRIVPYDVRGTKFGIKEKRASAEYVIQFYMNGLLVMDDLDNYMTGHKGQSMIGALTTVRHQGLDLILTHQAAGKVSTTEWENASFVRLHHQLDDIDTETKNYPLIKIGYLIVKKRFLKAEDDYAKGLISQEEYWKRRGSYVYIDMKKLKILCCSKEEFQQAAMEMIRIHPRRISERMNIGDELGKELNREEAIRSLYNDYAYFFPNN